MPATTLTLIDEAQRRHPALRAATDAEIALLTAACEAGAYLLTDDCWVDFITDPAPPLTMPVSWGGFAVATRWITQQEADECNARVEARRNAFYASAEAVALAQAVIAERSGLARAA